MAFGEVHIFCSRNSIAALLFTIICIHSNYFSVEFPSPPPHNKSSPSDPLHRQSCRPCDAWHIGQLQTPSLNAAQAADHLQPLQRGSALLQHLQSVVSSLGWGNLSLRRLRRPLPAANLIDCRRLMRNALLLQSPCY